MPRKLSLAITLAFFIFQIDGFAQDLPSQNISSEIKSLTVFLNNAEIHREVELEIPQGKSEVIFENISSRILDKGIKISTSNEVVVYTVSLDNDSTSFKNSSAYLAIKDSLDFIEKEQLLSKINRVSYQKELQFLEANMKVHNASDIQFAKIDEAQTYFAEKVNAIQKKIVDEDEKWANLQDKHNNFMEQEEKAKETFSKTNAKVKIVLLSDKATTCKIQLRYLVSNALWKPLYSIRATEGSPNITIEYQAQLYNDTGIDWDNKPITLAILDSSEDLEKPELEIWSLDENTYEYSDRRNFSSNRKSGKKDKAEEQEEAFDILELDDLSTRFELDDQYTIPADASPHLIDVTKYEKAVSYYNLSIPKIKNGAFLIARVQDWENLGLIDGQANLYYNNTYQGYTNLKTQQINDTLDISLGKVNSYTVSRRKIHSKSKRNLIGFNIKEELTYEISIRNNRNEKGVIEIKDQIPVSTSKDVEIKPINLSNGKLDPVTGEINWEVKLKPEEVKTLLLKFSIKYPKNRRHIFAMKYASRVRTPRYF